MAVRSVVNAKSDSTVQVAPAARSICALLLARDVAVQHLDGVLDVLMNDERLRDNIPHSMAEIVADVDAAHQIYLAQLVTVVEADQSGTPRL